MSDVNFRVRRAMVPSPARWRKKSAREEHPTEAVLPWRMVDADANDQVGIRFIQRPDGRPSASLPDFTRSFVAIYRAVGQGELALERKRTVGKQVGQRLLKGSRRVLRQPVALLHQRIQHRVQAVVVGKEAAIALLDRRARIVVGQSLRLGLRERNIAAGEVLLLPLENAAR